MATAFKMPSVREQVSAQEWELRVDLACAYRAVAHFGWDDLVFTHLSARVADEEFAFLLNPFNLLFDEVTASSLLKLDAKGRNLVDNGMPLNPAGFVIHSAVQMARPDTRVVMHLHTVAGTAVSSMQCGLLPVTQAAASIVPEVAYHDYEGIAVDEDERERLVAHLGDKTMMLLRNHGTLAVGATVGEAFMRLYFLERACQMQVAMMAGGPDNVLAPPPEAAQQAHAQSERMAGWIANELAWPAIRRRMERLDPSFME